MGSITLSPFLYAFYLPKNAIHSASATAPYGAVAEKDKKLFGLGNTVGFHILCVDILDLLQAGGHGGNDGKHQNDHVTITTLSVPVIAFFLASMVMLFLLQVLPSVLTFSV
mgnify:FL=1